MPTVALIYGRRSMVRYDQDRASPEHQIAHCIRVCEEKGWQYDVRRMPSAAAPVAPKSIARHGGA